MPRGGPPQLAAVSWRGRPFLDYGRDVRGVDDQEREIAHPSRRDACSIRGSSRVRTMTRWRARPRQDESDGAT